MSKGLGDDNNPEDAPTGGHDPAGQAPGASAAAPAGWYPVDGGGQRYWDGAAWTDHIAPAPGAAPSPPPPAAGAPGSPGAPQAPAAPAIDAPGAPGAGFPPGVGDPQPVWGAAPAAPFGQGQPPAPGGPIPSTSDDRTMALLCHVLGLFTGFIGPLIVWLIKKDQSRFVDHHGRQALNFQISMFILWMITFVLIFVLIGLLLIPVLLVWGIVMPIIAAVAANKGEEYRYPLTIPFLG